MNHISLCKNAKSFIIQKMSSLLGFPIITNLILRSSSSRLARCALNANVTKDLFSSVFHPFAQDRNVLNFSRYTTLERRCMDIETTSKRRNNVILTSCTSWDTEENNFFLFFFNSEFRLHAFFIRMV